MSRTSRISKKNKKSTKSKTILGINASIQSLYNEPSYVTLYDSRYTALQRQKYQHILPAVSFTHDMMLDIGTGTGLLWTFIMEQMVSDSKIAFLDKKYQILHHFRFIGVDFAREMLCSFRKKAYQDTLESRATTNMPHLICADGEHLPFRDDLFWEVYSVTTLQNLSDPLQGLREMRRVSQIPVRMGITILRKKIALDIWTEMLHRMFPEAKFLFLSSDNKDIQDNYEEDWIAVLELSQSEKTT